LAFNCFSFLLLADKFIILKRTSHRFLTVTERHAALNNIFLPFICLRKEGIMADFSNRTLLVILLWIFVVHSTVVALLLIFLPAESLHYFGYSGYQGRFFQVQGGVFHLVMAVAYLIAAVKTEKAGLIIIFIIVAKTMATVFLLSYFFLSEHIWILLPSAAGDGAMAVLLFLFYRRYTKEKNINMI